MSELLGPDGKPASTYAERKTGRPKNPKPIMGEFGGAFSQGDLQYMQLPGGGALQIDTSKLTLGDFRRMSEHPQIASSLRLLSFMTQQLEWKLEGGTAQTRAHVEDNLELIWTPLIRSMCSAFKFGFSANATQWENRPGNSRVYLNKIKDLIPEDCDVNWKWVEGAKGPDDNVVRPKVAIFDGIRQWGKHTIPVTNAFWYPFLMENGDYKGTRILRSAFQSWYFSNLIKLFANQYYERFGSPLPVGRAPYEEEINIGTQDNPKMIPGNQLMGNIIGALRNRSAVVLPNQRTQDGIGGVKSFDYQLEYLESQLRGAEWDRMITMYNEDMSLAMFTPLMMMRTTESGGQNLGIGHQQVFLWMLNAIALDLREYLNRYLIPAMTKFNFGANAVPPRIKFRKMGTAQQETLRAIVQTMVSNGQIMPDVEELGAHIGLDLEEIKQMEEPLAEPGDEDNPEDDEEESPATKKKDKRIGRPDRLKNDDQANVTNPKAVTKQITARVSQQAQKAFANGSYNKNWLPSLGYRRQLAESFVAYGCSDPQTAASDYERMALALLEDCVDVHDYRSAEEVTREFGLISDTVLEGVMANG